MSNNSKEFLETLVVHYGAQIKTTLHSISENPSLDNREKFVVLATILSSEFVRFFNLLSSFDHECNDKDCQHNKAIVGILREEFINVLNGRNKNATHSNSKIH